MNTPNPLHDSFSELFKDSTFCDFSQILHKAPDSLPSAKYFLILASFDREIYFDLRKSSICIDLTRDTVTFESHSDKVTQDLTLNSLIDRLHTIQNTAIEMFSGSRDEEIECFKAAYEVKSYLRSMSCCLIHHHSMLPTLNFYSKQKNVSIKGLFNRVQTSYLISTRDNIDMAEVQKTLISLYSSLRKTKTCIQISKKTFGKPYRGDAFVTSDKVLGKFRKYQVTSDFRIQYNSDTSQWEIIYEFVTFLSRELLDQVSDYFYQLFPRPEEKRELLLTLNYFQYKFFNNFLQKEFLEDNFTNVTYNVRVLSKKFDMEDLIKFNTKFATVMLNGPSKSCEAAYNAIQYELRRMRLKELEIFYRVSFNSLTAAIAAYLPYVAKRKVQSLLKRKCEIQLSKFIPYTKELSHNIVRLFLIYEKDVEIQILNQVETEINLLISRLTELKLEIAPDALRDRLKDRGIKLDTYFEKKDAVIVSARKLDVRVVIAGQRHEIEEFKRIVETETVKEEVKTKGLLVNIGSDLVYGELLEKAHHLDNISDNYENSSIKPSTNNNLKIEARKIQDIKEMKEQINKLITNIEKDLITIEEEIPKAAWDHVQSFTPEQILKKFSIKIKEIPQISQEIIEPNSPQQRVQWYWKNGDQVFPFCTEHNKIIEEGFQGKEEVILDGTIVDKGANMLFDFEKCEIVDLIRNKISTLLLLPAKNSIYQHYGEEGPKKICDELTQLVLKHREEKKQEKIPVFSGDYTVLHTEKVLVNSKTQDRYPLMRKIEVIAEPEEEEEEKIAPIQPEVENKTSVEISGLRKKVEAFIIDIKGSRGQLSPEKEAFEGHVDLDVAGIIDDDNDDNDNDCPRELNISHNSDNIQILRFIKNQYARQNSDPPSNYSNNSFSSKREEMKEEIENSLLGQSQSIAGMTMMFNLTTDLGENLNLMDTKEPEDESLNQLFDRISLLPNFNDTPMHYEFMHVSSQTLKSNFLGIKHKAKELRIDLKLDYAAKRVYFAANDVLKVDFRRFLTELEYQKLLPEYWSGPYHKDFSYNTYPVSSNTLEFNRIKILFERNLLLGYNESSLKIERVQNYFLIKKWMDKCLEYQQQSGQDSIIRQLFFGSTKKSPYEVVNNNNVSFPMNLASLSSVGNGLCFSETAVDIIENGFKKGDEEGTKVIILAMVMLGNHTTFERYILLDDDIKYQAIKGKSKSGDTYTLFEENMAYPLYIIEYNENF